ncbi:multiple PDZ domain protein-like [Paramacrobiotus metropolitanus]|uniref:multiple PDZ domain protein-like n=1 Tax=Paramacrobiotus metropolitanus TaxID=2943436 RepID=UPI0024460F0B|nr:multiple PDZ domain protein-like [Paramacrobiotus metropolitanus]
MLWLAKLLLGISLKAVPEYRLPEVITIVLRRENGQLGFSMVGGRATREGDLEIFVQRIAPGESAEGDGRLKHGDQIVRVNGESVLAATYNEAVTMLQYGGNSVTLDIVRGSHYPCSECAQSLYG